MGHNFVSGLRTLWLKPKNPKTFSKSLGFYQPRLCSIKKWSRKGVL